MADEIVSKLKQQLEVAGIDTLHLSTKEAALFAQVIEEKAEFFDTVCQQSPDKKPILLLLGLLTKQQIEATGKLESQVEQICKMHNIFSETVGEQEASRFGAQAVIELSLVTKIWLMVQGYLNMDFSLANDYALNTATLLTKALHVQEMDELRTELLAGYYHGKEKRQGDEPSAQWSDKLFSWFTGRR